MMLNVVSLPYFSPSSLPSSLAVARSCSVPPSRTSSFIPPTLSRSLALLLARPSLARSGRSLPSSLLLVVPSPPGAVDFNDLHAYDPVARLWYAPGIISGPGPSARGAAGFAVLSGSLYLFGGGPGDASGSARVLSFGLFGKPSTIHRGSGFVSTENSVSSLQLLPSIVRCALRFNVPRRLQRPLRLQPLHLHLDQPHGAGGRPSSFAPKVPRFRPGGRPAVRLWGPQQ